MLPLSPETLRGLRLGFDLPEVLLSSLQQTDALFYVTVARQCACSFPKLLPDVAVHFPFAFSPISTMRTRIFQQPLGARKRISPGVEKWHPRLWEGRCGAWEWSSLDATDRRHILPDPKNVEEF